MALGCLNAVMLSSGLAMYLAAVADQPYHQYFFFFKFLWQEDNPKDVFGSSIFKAYGSEVLEAWSRDETVL